MAKDSHIKVDAFVSRVHLAPFLLCFFLSLSLSLSSLSLVLFVHFNLWVFACHALRSAEEEQKVMRVDGTESELVKIGWAKKARMPGLPGPCHVNNESPVVLSAFVEQSITSNGRP